MGTSPPVYSSVSGPAKWAAVVILTAACSAGLTYSLVAKQPRAAQATAPPAKELPPRKAHVPPAAIQPIEPQSTATPPAPAAAIPPPPSTSTQPQAATQAPPAPAAVSVEPAPPVIEPPTPAHKLNLNNAPASHLELLPGIGPAMAERIVSYRTLHGPFRSIKDLDKVKGIGPKTLEKLAPLITVD